MRTEHNPTIAPLTEQQVRELAQVRAGAMSRIACGYLVDGQLDMAHLRRAVATVIDQHTALRTAVVSNDSMDGQVVLPYVDSPLFEFEGAPEDVSVLGMVDLVERRIGRDRIRMNHAPMWWIAVVHLSRTSHVLVGLCSRLVMDYVSIAVMFRCVLSAYLLQGRVAQPTPVAQYRSYSLAQDRWRRESRGAWVDRWCERVDFGQAVSSRGLFPNASPAKQQRASDMFELPQEAMALARRLAARRHCELLTVLVAAVVCLERDSYGTNEHRIVVSCPGRAGNEDRAIGAYQLNGLIAFRSADEDDLDGVLEDLREAWSFTHDNLGIGIEALLEAVNERRGVRVPVPFRLSVHAGEPPPSPEIPRGSKFRLDFLPNLAERAAPLDPHTECSVMFVLGGERDAAMLSWWEGDERSTFYENFWQTYPAALLKLLRHEARAAGEDGYIRTASVPGGEDELG